MTPSPDASTLAVNLQSHVWDAVHLDPGRQVTAIYIFHGDAQVVRRQEHLLSKRIIDGAASVTTLHQGLVCICTYCCPDMCVG